MFCRDLMKTRVIHGYEDESASVCARRMTEFKVGFLPVVDAAGTLVGVVTDRDLALRVLGRERPGNTPVRDVMTRQVHVCHPEEELREAEERMARCRHSRLVVVDASGRCAGVIALSDIARTDADSRTGWLLNALGRERPAVASGEIGG
jgi:CBS domain-containing protein